MAADGSGYSYQFEPSSNRLAILYWWNSPFRNRASVVFVWTSGDNETDDVGSSSIACVDFAAFVWLICNLRQRCEVFCLSVTQLVCPPIVARLISIHLRVWLTACNLLICFARFNGHSSQSVSQPATVDLSRILKFDSNINSAITKPTWRLVVDSCSISQLVVACCWLLRYKRLLVECNERGKNVATWQLIWTLDDGDLK